MVSENTAISTTENEKKTPQQPIPLRLRFRKTGMLQFISHLDLLRTMEHVVVRAKIPVRFSEGFNPHARITFALPLSVGAESEVECMDLLLTKPVDYDWAVWAMNEQLPAELRVYHADAGVHKVGQIGFAAYEITLQWDGCRPEDAERLNELYHNPLIITKRTKSGEKETDISPMIRRAVCRYEDGAVKIDALLSAGGETGILNPEYLIKAAVRYLGYPLDDPERAECRILRRQLYLGDGETVFA